MILGQKDKKGFSLLELLLVVSVGILLILAALAIYRNVTNQRLNNEARTLLNVVKQETQKLFQGQPTYGANGQNLVGTLIAAESIPTQNINGNAATTPFDTALTVTAVAGGRFTVTFAAVPRSACINIGASYNATDTDFVGLTIMGAPVANTDVATLVGACTGVVNNMVWTFN